METKVNEIDWDPLNLSVVTHSEDEITFSAYDFNSMGLKLSIACMS